MANEQHTYELTYIINPVAKDRQISQLVDRVRSLIEDNGGEIIEVDEWGSQRMAYPIERKRNGHYVNMFFKAPGALVGELERRMNLEDNILRYLTLRMDTKMLEHYERTRGGTALATEEGEEEA